MDNPSYTKGVEAGLLAAYEIALANEKEERQLPLFKTSELILNEINREQNEVSRAE